MVWYLLRHCASVWMGLMVWYLLRHCASVWMGLMVWYLLRPCSSVVDGLVRNQTANLAISPLRETVALGYNCLQLHPRKLRSGRRAHLG